MRIPVAQLVEARQSAVRYAQMKNSSEVISIPTGDVYGIVMEQPTEFILCVFCVSQSLKNI